MRFAVVGFGFMGQTHCGNLLKMPDVEVVAIVDPVSPVERLQTVKGNLQTVSICENDVCKIPHYTDLETALKETSPDAAVICLPTFLHCSGTLAALKHGVHVFVEKPFALTGKECSSMLECAESADRLIAVGYVVRLIPEYAYLQETVAGGRLGKLKFLQLRRITGVPAWGNWSDPATVKAVGGALFDLTSHDIDFARFILGEPENITVDPLLCREFNGNYTSAVLHYPGCRVSVEGGFVTPSSFPFFSGYRAFFEKGTLTGDHAGNCCEYDLQGRVKQVELEQKDPYFSEMRYFVNAVEGKSEVICSGADAAKTVACCNRIKQLISGGENR